MESTTVNIKREVGIYFFSYWAMRQGGIFNLLFNIHVDIFAVILEKDKEVVLIKV